MSGDIGGVLFYVLRVFLLEMHFLQRNSKSASGWSGSALKNKTFYRCFFLMSELERLDRVAVGDACNEHSAGEARDGERPAAVDRLLLQQGAAH